MLDLTFSINGDRLRPFGEPISLSSIESVDETTGALKHSMLSLKIYKGDFEHSYSSIGVKLVSACEWGLASDWLYRDPISDESFLGDFKWERKCPLVTWDKGTYNDFSSFVASRKDPPFLNITLMNPDPMNLWTSDRWKPSGRRRMKEGTTPVESEDQVVGWDAKKNHLVHPNVEFVRLQWRKTGVGEWINAWDVDWSSWSSAEAGVTKNFENFFKKYSNDGSEEKRRKQMQELFKLDVITEPDLQCATSRGAGCSLKWNLARQYFLNGLKDGSYEVRAKVFCSGYDSFATSDVRGSVTDENLSLSVDVTPPKAVSTSTLDRIFSVEYTEPIICPQQKASAMTYSIAREKDCAGVAVPDDKKTISDEHVFFNFGFTCMTGSSLSPNSKLVVEFPETMKMHDGKYSTTSGVYSVTVNANEGASKLTDTGENPARKQTFTVTIGDSECAQSLKGTPNLGDSSSNDTIERVFTARLGEQTRPMLGASAVSYLEDKVSILFGFCATILITAGIVFVAMSPSRSSKGDEDQNWLRSSGRRGQRNRPDVSSREVDRLVDASQKLYGSVI